MRRRFELPVVTTTTASVAAPTYWGLEIDDEDPRWIHEWWGDDVRGLGSRSQRLETEQEAMVEVSTLIAAKIEEGYIERGPQSLVRFHYDISSVYEEVPHGHDLFNYEENQYGPGILNRDKLGAETDACICAVSHLGRLLDSGDVRLRMWAHSPGPGTCTAWHLIVPRANLTIELAHTPLGEFAFGTWSDLWPQAGPLLIAGSDLDDESPFQTRQLDHGAGCLYAMVLSGHINELDPGRFFTGLTGPTRNHVVEYLNSWWLTDWLDYVRENVDSFDGNDEVAKDMLRRIEDTDDDFERASMALALNDHLGLYALYAVPTDDFVVDFDYGDYLGVGFHEVTATDVPDHLSLWTYYKEVKARDPYPHKKELAQVSDAVQLTAMELLGLAEGFLWRDLALALRLIDPSTETSDLMAIALGGSEQVRGVASAIPYLPSEIRAAAALASGA